MEETNNPKQADAKKVDRLLTREQANALLGLKGKTSHTLRAMAARGQIEAVRLNGRVLRFRESSIIRLVSGGA